MKMPVLLVATALCAAGAFAQTVNLTYAPKPGDAIGFEVKMHGQIDVPQMQGLNFEATSAHTTQVTESADGRVAIELTLGASEVWIGPQQLVGGSEGEIAKFALDGSGIVDEVFQKLPATVGQGADGVILLTLAGRELALPAKEVAVGDTWEITRAERPSLIDLPEQLELYGTPTWKGKLVSADATAIIVELELDTADAAQGQGGVVGHMTGTSKLTLDPETRELVLAECTMTYETQMGQGGGTVRLHDTTYTLTRVQ